MIWRYRDWPIRRKLELITIVAAVAALTVGVGGSFAYHSAAARSQMADELRSLAEVIGASTNAPAAVRDERVAAQALSGLKARPTIRAAALYDRDGNRVGEYVRPNSASRTSRTLPVSAEQWTDEALAVWVPVAVGGTRVGAVYLEEGLERIDPIQRSEWMLVAAAVPLAMLLVSWLSKPFRSPVGRPIVELAQLARRAARDKDYSVRARSDAADEIGVLAEGFNDLVTRLQELHWRVGEHSEELELEVSRRTTALRQINSELQAAKDAADAASLAKTQFIANVSHELRTPITGVLGTAHLLASSTLDVEQREWLGMVIQSAETLLSLIDDLLDFSRIESGRLSIESVPFNPREEAQAAVKLFAHHAAEKGLRLDCVVRGDVPGAVMGDPVRFRQVITNLLGNAVKFTMRGSVRVTLSVNQAGPSGVELHGEVTDTGIGIPLDRQDAIFNPFTQADPSTTRRFGGSGLGLAICSRLLAMMGGRIWVDSAPGRGSTFHFTVRTRRTTEQPMVMSSSTAPAVQMRPLAILCVEDSPITQRVTTQLLTRAGHRVDLAQTGAEAVALVAHRRYDVVLMDLQMPEMDGVAAAQAIRVSERGTGEHVPIIALTAHALASDRVRCLEAGMDGYVSKPFRPAELMAAIAAVVPDASESRAPAAAPPALETAGMTDVLIVEYESKLKELEVAVAAGKLGDVRNLTHRLKSAMALFHTGEPFMIADRLETFAAEGDGGGVAQTWPLLQRRLQAILDELHHT